MACFVVPAAEAIVTTVAAKVVKSKENKEAEVKIIDEVGSVVAAERIPFSRKLRWLTNLLWGGSLLLAFEHVWHGEVTPWFPFLTAAGNPEDAAEMLREMSTAGITMAVLVTAVWGLMLAGAHVIENRAIAEAAPEAK